MRLILAVLLGFLVFGVCLAEFDDFWPMRPGYIGAIALILVATWANRRWQQRRERGEDPTAAERNAWVCLAATALIAGFVGSVLLTPGSEVHRTTGDTGGWDSWVMLFGAAVAWWWLREPAGATDERDRAIDAHANRVGYGALILLLVIFMLILGFAPKASLTRFTHWLIANTMLQIIMIASLVQNVTLLTSYARAAARSVDDEGIAR